MRDRQTDEVQHVMLEGDPPNNMQRRTYVVFSAELFAQSATAGPASRGVDFE